MTDTNHPADAVRFAGGQCHSDGLMFDAFGNQRMRYVRISLDGSHCVMPAREGDAYVSDARADGDDSPYIVAEVWLSEREFDKLPEHNGF